MPRYAITCNRHGRHTPMAPLDSHEHRPAVAWGRSLRLAVFLVAWLLYVWLRVDPSLLYYSHWTAYMLPPFRFGGTFAGQVLLRPGGLATYLSGFLCVLYCVPAVGAAAIALATGLLVLTSSAIGAQLSGKRPRYLHFVPAAVVLLAYSRYTNPLTTVVATVLAAALAFVYVWMPARGPALRLAAFGVLGLAAAWWAGAAWLLFVLLCVLWHLSRRSYRLAGACLAGGAILPAVVAAALRTPLADAYVAASPAGSEMMHSGTSIAFGVPGAVLLVGVIWAFRPRLAARIGAAGSAEVPQVPVPAGRTPAMRWLAGTALVLVAVALPSLAAFRPATRSRLRIDVYGQYGAWQQVIDEARRLEAEDFTLATLWDVNRALFRLGHLLDGMFAFPQSPQALLPQPQDMGTNASAPGGAALPVMRVKCADLMLDLGLVNEAEEAAMEAWEVFGDRPELLRRLAEVNAAKGRGAAAAVFARAAEEDASVGPALASLLAGPAWVPVPPPETGPRGSRAQRGDEDTYAKVPADRLLARLLLASPDNPMAFEYLVAQCLLNREFGKLAAALAYLQEFGYPSMPSSCEEALLVNEQLTGTRVVVPGYPLSTESLRRFAAFRRISVEHRGDADAARKAMAEELPGTYLLYFAFPEAGGGLL